MGSYEPPHDKTNKMACAPSEDSDQPGRLPSLISLHCRHEETLGPQLPIESTAKTDQTGRMSRLSESVLGALHFVGFIMLRLRLSFKPRDQRISGDLYRMYILYICI